MTDSKKKLIEPGHIGYKFIIKISHFRKTISLLYEHPQTNKSITWNIKVKEIDTAIMLLNYSIKYIQEYILEKVRRAQKEKDMESLKLRGGWVDDLGVLHGPMLEFIASKHLNPVDKEGNVTVWLDLDYSGDYVTNAIKPVLKLDSDLTHCLLVRLYSGSYKCLLPEMKIEDVHPVRKTYLILIPREPIITFKFFDYEPVQIKVDITKPIKDLVSMVAEKFNISSSLGYTFCLNDNPLDPTPLDFCKTISEQAHQFETLYLGRKFFVLTDSDTENPNNMNALYKCCHQEMLKGRFELTSDQATDLAYHSLFLENEGEVTIPNDLTTVYPQSTKVPFRAMKTLQLKFQNEPITDRNFALQKYISIARSIPSFGSWKFYCNLIDDRQGKIYRTKCIFFVAPYRCYATDTNGQKEIAECSYKRFIRSTDSKTEVAIKFSKEDEQNGFIYLESPDSEKISNLVYSHIDIHQELLKLRIPQLNLDENPANSLDRVDLLVVRGLDRSTSQRVSLDKRYTGGQIMILLAKKLDLDLVEGQYSLLLKLTHDEYRWIDFDTVVGAHNPCDGMILFILNTYMFIKCILKTGFSRMVLLNITWPVIVCNQKVAEKLFVDHYLGYTLYRKQSENEYIPLDIHKTIPEQVDEFTEYYFLRRFHLYCKQDFSFLVLLTQNLFGCFRFYSSRHNSGT